MLGLNCKTKYLFFFVFIGTNAFIGDERFKLTEFQEGTEVLMGDLTKEIIEAYVDTGEPM